MAQDSVGDAVPERAIANLFFGRRFPAEDAEKILVSDAEKSQFTSLEHIYLREEFETREVDGEISSVRRLRRIPKVEAVDLTSAVEAIEVISSEGSDLLGSAPRTSRFPLAELFGARRGFTRMRFEDSTIGIPHSYVSSRFNTQSSLAEAWDAVVLTDGENLALEALRLIEPQTIGLAFVQNSRPRNPRSAISRGTDERVAVLKVRGIDGPVPLQSMGDGMARVLQLVLSALRAGDGFLLVDEIENGLHFSVQEKVWDALFSLSRTYGLQIFATTHSNDCVHAFSEVSVRFNDLEGKLLHMDRVESNGEAVVSVMSEHGLTDLISSSVEVR